MVRGGAMIGGSGAHCYGALGHKTMNKRHGKTAKLTMIRLERSAASGEVESKELKVKSRKSRYLRHRWVMVELQDTSVMGIALGNEGFTGGGGELKHGRRKERGRGSGSGFIGGPSLRRWKGSEMRAD